MKFLALADLHMTYHVAEEMTKVEELINSENAQTIIMNALQFDIELQMLKLFAGNENAIFQPILNDVVKEQINYYEIAKNILE